MPVAVKMFLGVVVGYVTMTAFVVALTLFAWRVMHVDFGRPAAGYMAANVVYSLAAAGLGGWVAGLIGRPKGLQTGYFLAAVMVGMGVVSAFLFKGSQPVWYQILMMVAPAGLAVVGAAVVGDSTEK